MELQPQLQPINPVEGRPFAEPPQPLDLRPRPARRPLDLRPRPETQQPLDLRPKPSQPAQQPMRLPRMGMPEEATQGWNNVLNNPMGYAPAKAITIPLAFVERTRGLHEELSTPASMQTLDIPAIPLPAEAFPDLELSPTTKLSPEAIGQGATIAEASPEVSGVQGGTAGAPYVVNIYGDGGTVSTGWHLTTVTGPVTVAWESTRPGFVAPFAYTASHGRIAVPQSGGNPYWERQSDQPYQSYPIHIPRTDGQPEPDPQPARQRQTAPNPARAPWGLSGLPEFQEMPELEFPGWEPEQKLAIVPAPTGEIVPYRPPGWEPDPAEPYLPPERQPFPGWPMVPDLSTPPGESPQDDDTKKGTLAPPWWDAWDGWELPDDWTNKKRNPRGDQPEQLPAPGTSTQTPPVAVVPYDGCCTETLNRLRDIQRKLEKLEVDSEIPSWSCDTTADPPAPTEERTPAKDLATAINLIGESLGMIQQQFAICPPPPVEQAEHAEIAKDTSTESKTVWYIALGADVRQVELIITGELPKSFRLYDTSADGEQQAKFGALALSCAGVTGGNTANSFHQWCWTRRTSMYVGHRSPRETFLRVYIRSGLSWVLYDTGLRE